MRTSKDDEEDEVQISWSKNYYEKFKEAAYPSIMVLERLLNIKIKLRFREGVRHKPENELPKGRALGMEDV